ncbi:heparinase II/III family protein [Sphingomonas immobilis]|uniref:Heparinase II/III family protein n=1 Tax=Sphingomonas immobilis TaxID=3063997 RepID=A0ABT8ZYL8_9SPHN|nr:heparinase II/III family protein [Sphingomonas sp. CA1-15]MDO7841552.1 heparinase II/III family protein [Sphingomonas sp. CA1-15]
MIDRSPEPETGSGLDDDLDTVDEGKRLVRVGGASGLSLAERLTERFHRLTWRTPIHGMRLKGRHPLKLIAVPDDPFLGDVKRGQALLSGQVTFRGETRAVAALNFAKPDFSDDFSEYLHSFGWLRDLSTVATRAQGVPVAEAIMRQWLAVHADKVSEPAWRADLWGRRILAWSAHAPLILSSADLVYRSKVLNTFARGARHLDRGVDKLPPGAPRVAANCGVVAASMLISGNETRRGAAEAALARAIATSVFEDGGVVSRSPTAQIDVIMLLTALRCVYDVRRFDAPEIIADTLAKMVPALLGVCMGDGALSSWQGGGPVSAASVADVIAATGVRTRPLRQAREWGYQRLASGQSVLVIDAAPPPVARLIKGGCASTLAFEFSDGPHRLIVNCGGARAGIVQIPAALSEGMRTTAAHSTLVVGDSNSTAVHADGTLGRGVGEVELARQESEQASRIEGSHDGYARRFGFTHHRQLILSGDGRELRGEDMLLPSHRRRRIATMGFVIRFHLGLGVEVSPTADGMAALLRLPGAPLWQFRVRGGTLSAEESVWIDAEGRPQSTSQLVVTGESPAGGANISWVLKRAV